MPGEDRYRAALKRNFDEILRALLEIRAHDALLAQEIYARADSFFFLSAHALFNDLVARAIKVLDINKDSDTFWYIYRCQTQRVDDILRDLGSSKDVIEDLAKRLKPVRDKTHFHLDKKGILDPKKVWKEAEISGLSEKLFVVFKVLRTLHIETFGNDGYPLEYDASDVQEIVEACRKAGLDY